MICAPPAPWVMAVCAREIDKGCRCAPRRPRRAHRRGAGSCCAQRSCASLSRAAGAAGLTRTGLGATCQSEGLLRVRGRARMRTPGPEPSGRSQTSNPSRKGVARAASRRRSTRWPTGWPSGCSGIAEEVFLTSPSRLAVSFPRGTAGREGSRGGGEGGVYIAILPDADRGMPRWGVPPSHGQGTRIGIGAPLAVAQPQARQRHMESEACPSQARFRCPATPNRHVQSRIGIGSVEDRLRIMAFRSNIDKLRHGGLSVANEMSGFCST